MSGGALALLLEELRGELSMGAFLPSLSVDKTVGRAPSFGAKSTLSRLRLIQSELRSDASTTERAALRNLVTCVALQNLRRSLQGMCASSGETGGVGPLVEVLGEELQGALHDHLLHSG